MVKMEEYVNKNDQSEYVMIGNGVAIEGRSTHTFGGGYHAVITLQEGLDLIAQEDSQGCPIYEKVGLAPTLH